MRGRLHCPIDGCSTSWFVLSVFSEEHMERRHYRCSCGSVGTEWTRHLAQRQRYGQPVSACRVVAWQRVRSAS